jgi:hypothetical protein
MAYSQTIGAGNYASLYDLMANGLIDNGLAFGENDPPAEEN